MITVRQILDAAWHRETALHMHWVDALNAACRLPGVNRLAEIQARKTVAATRARLKSAGDTTTSPLEAAYYSLPTLTRFKPAPAAPSAFPPKGTLTMAS